MRRQLGEQLDRAAASDLIARINELTEQNQQLIAERDAALERERSELEGRLAEAEDDLAATRASLRRSERKTSRRSDDGALPGAAFGPCIRQPKRATAKLLTISTKPVGVP